MILKIDKIDKIKMMRNKNDKMMKNKNNKK